ncbi:hypothetical protein ACFOM8_01960 [Paracoccus angustae]|uniref:Uncharacterized protein n=1 Tax=Paracoccus angustae TaxID=1671480 RepID=A0ABV7TZR3_9RHOB
MTNVIYLTPLTDGSVPRTSVQVSEYSPENGGADAGTGRIYAVETLFADGKWAIEGHFRDLAEAHLKAGEVAIARGAVLLPESVWPNRKVAI